MEIKQINVDSMLEKHYKQNKVFFTSNEKETVKVAIKEIVEAVLKEAAKNAEIKIGKSMEWMIESGEGVDVSINKSSIFNTKNQVKY